jgi:hypothetical protein
MTYTPATEPPTYPCFVFLERGGAYFGDTPYAETLTPLEAVYEVFQGCDFYPYQYREVEYADPAATLDVYVATAPNANRHVATLARIYPTCCFCGGPMRLGEDSPWLYGYDAEPVAAREERCCSSCYASKVEPARAAARAAEEARYRAEEAALEAAYRARKEAER